jgi:hypothetical protein
MMGTQPWDEEYATTLAEKSDDRCHDLEKEHYFERVARLYKEPIRRSQANMKALVGKLIPSEREA